MKKIIVGISGSMIFDEGGNMPGYERAYVNNDYVQAVVRAGGIPYIIPMVSDEEVIKEQILNVDALILSGGQDVDPLFYGEEPKRNLGGILPQRDIFDMSLINFAMEKKIPILGICRGEQILNVANGGTLYQDLAYIPDSYIKHNQQRLPHTPTHTIIIDENSELGKILGKEAVVNSFHHLAIKDVAPGFKMIAHAKDGVVEGIEKIDEHFIMAVQFHPEMLSEFYPKMQKIFDRLVEEAKIRKDK